jgi:hypothetical protein
LLHILPEGFIWGPKREFHRMFQGMCPMTGDFRAQHSYAASESSWEWNLQVVGHVKLAMAKLTL